MKQFYEDPMLLPSAIIRENSLYPFKWLVPPWCCVTKAAMWIEKSPVSEIKDVSNVLGQIPNLHSPSISTSYNQLDWIWGHEALQDINYEIYKIVDPIKKTLPDAKFWNFLN